MALSKEAMIYEHARVRQKLKSKKDKQTDLLPDRTDLWNEGQWRPSHHVLAGSAYTKCDNFKTHEIDLETV